MQQATRHVFSPEEILRGYKIEAEGLAVIAKSGALGKNLPVFENYEDYLRSVRRNDHASRAAVRKLVNAGGVIDVRSGAPEARSFFYHAHLAACCFLFNNWELSFDDLTMEKLEYLVTLAINKAMRGTNGALDPLSDPLLLTDTVRVTSLLRCMGLFTLQGDACCQLSIGAGSGSRDIEAMHYIPEIRTIEKRAALGASVRYISLKAIARYPAEIVLVDADEAFSEVYQRLNTAAIPFRVVALNLLLNDALEQLPEKLDASGMKPFNVIAGFRIDHCMLPDVGDFFDRVAALMTDTADLIITIGAGHSLDEFIGRERKIGEIQAYLAGKGLTPVRIRLTSGDTPQERRRNLAFGLLPVASYEILYCKLKRKLLLRGSRTTHR